MAVSNFVITLAFNGATQGEADTRRDNGVLDYAKLRNLPIYAADGITLLSNAAIATLVKNDIKSRLREDVIRYREFVASNTAAAGVAAAVLLELP